MDAHAGAVDHAHVATVSVSNCVHDPVADPRLRPAPEAVVACGVRPIALRQVAPRRPRAQHPEDAVQHPPVIHPRHPARLVGQQRFDHPPLKLGQIIAAPPRLPSRRLESNLRRLGNPDYESTA